MRKMPTNLTREEIEYLLGLFAAYAAGARKVGGRLIVDHVMDILEGREAEDRQ